jgi:hypothetical protein
LTTNPNIESVAHNIRAAELTQKRFLYLDSVIA